MSKTFFDWDEAKNRSNLKKHGVSFEDAIGVFLDPYNVTDIDRIVDSEERWQTFGVVDDELLMVAHAIYDDGDSEIVRIISARLATRAERKRYEEQHG
jgi:uncharacterized protein